MQKNRVERTISPAHRMKGSTLNPIYIIARKYKDVKRFSKKSVPGTSPGSAVARRPFPPQGNVI
jgi:hypothetical protein